MRMKSLASNHDLSSGPTDPGAGLIIEPTALLERIEQSTEGMSWQGRSMIDVLLPYSYDSLDDYCQTLARVSHDIPDLRLKALLRRYVHETTALNDRSNWSIVRYLGSTTEFHLTHGRDYYWPASPLSPFYQGVIDDECFTAYLYPIDSTLWEIREDPTGMAKATLTNRHIGPNSHPILYFLLLPTLERAACIHLGPFGR